MLFLSYCIRNWIGIILIFFGGLVFFIKIRCCRNIFRFGCRDARLYMVGGLCFGFGSRFRGF